MQNATIYIVSGLPRSGTSMMMKILTDGGLEALVDNLRKPDDDNPKGYFEYKPAMKLHKDNSWLGLAVGKAVKIMVNFTEFLPDDYHYKIILIRRDLDEILASQQIMLKEEDKRVDDIVRKIFTRDVEKAKRIAKERENIEMLEVWYPDVVRNPGHEIERIYSFLELDLDKDKMLEAVDPKLYRNKKK
ncbi:MAG: sulfotransferase [Candidatus Dojkabacteria bacterium]|nr:sulfotransferase [Candidatus Dojkabacteria bacterium]